MIKNLLKNILYHKFKKRQVFFYSIVSQNEQKNFFWNILEIENFIYELLWNVEKGVYHAVLG